MLLPLLLLPQACSPPPSVPGGALSVSLEGAWDAARGVAPLPRPGESREIQAQRRLVLPADWNPKTRAVLRANGMGWRVQVAVDGVVVGSDIGGLRPIEVDLTGHLHAGTQVLALSVAPAHATNVVPGETVPSVVAWTYDQPRTGEARAIGEIWLELGALRRIDDVSVTYAAGSLHARASVGGADGQTVTFTVVRDGAVLTTFPPAPVAQGVASADASWEGPRWELGGSDQPFLQYLVATLPSGESRQVRFGARAIARDGKRLLLNGEEAYLAVERFMSQGYDARQELGGAAPLYARAGLNAVELHASMHADAFLSAADELGLLMVITPVCDGRQRADGIVPATPEWAAFQAEANRRVAAAHRGHPSMVLWNVEGNADPRFPALYAAYAASGIPAIDLRESLGYNDDSYARLRAEGPLPLYVNELAFRSYLYGGKTMIERLEALLQEHRSQGFGLTLPNVLTSRTPDHARAPETIQFVAEERAMLARAGVRPFVLGGVRRGPSTLAVTVTRGATPVAGEVVLLRAPGQALVAAAADATGVATLSLDYAGAAEIGTWGGAKWEPVTLVPGRYSDGLWKPSVTKAGLILE